MKVVRQSLAPTSVSSSPLISTDDRHTSSCRYIHRCSGHTVDTSGSDRNWHPTSWIKKSYNNIIIIMRPAIWKGTIWDKSSSSNNSPRSITLHFLGYQKICYRFIILICCVCIMWFVITVRHLHSSYYLWFLWTHMRMCPHAFFVAMWCKLAGSFVLLLHNWRPPPILSVCVVSPVVLLFLRILWHC